MTHDLERGGFEYSPRGDSVGYGPTVVDGLGSSSSVLVVEQEMPQAEAEAIFSEMVKKMEEESMAEAEIKILGRLDSLLPKELFHGKISLDRRIAEGEITREEHEASLKVIEKCYVPVTPGASIRCVDGRGPVGFDPGNPADYEIGPQIQGGTVDVAVAKRLKQGVSPDDTLTQDVQQEVEEPHPAAPGAHTAVGHESTCGGCGACMGQEEKLGYYQKDEYVSGMDAVIQATYQADGKEAPADALAGLPKQAAALEVIADTYYKHKPKIIEFMTKFRSDIKGMKQVLEGVHNEGVAILNLVRGTTLLSGKVNHLTDGKINAFGLDVWYILDEYPEEAPILLADAIATLMNLTDGSVEVGFRLPNESVAHAA